MTIDLSGLIKAGLSGATGYLAGEQADRVAKQKAAIEQQERARQARQDALREGLLRAQTNAANALTQQRRTAHVTPPKVSIQAGADGTLYRINRATGETFPITYQGKAVKRRTPGAASGSQPTAGQRERDAEDEARGLAILNTPLPPDLYHAATEGFKAARAAGSTLSPGRLTLQVMQGLRQSRPELFRQAPAAGDHSKLDSDALLAQALGLTPTPSGAQPMRTPSVQPGYTADAKARFNAGQQAADTRTPVTQAEYDTIVGMQGAAYARQHFVVRGG